MNTRSENARIRALVLTALLLCAWPFALEGQRRADLFDAMDARNIGPAGMSGRTVVVDVDPTDKSRIFVGGASGGVWRSTDGGVTWEHSFADAPVESIGHLDISPVIPDIVWVGTGEAHPRQSVSIGAGVFLSVDGGASWTQVGLESSERISRVIAHPTDPDVAYVGAMGPLWSDGEQRGLFKTTDRGETWERVLYVDEATGVADMVMDPTNPDKLLVAMYEFRRWPWFFESGGPGSGLFLTLDGGETWRELGPDDGIPEKPLGRIGLAISRSAPEVVYALVQAETNALLRSDDGGHTWRTVNDEPGISPRPMYFADIRVDPKNENRIYRLAGTTDVSEDAGRTWRTVVPSRRIHGDVHELWIDPDDPRHMIMGNDGGLGITRDRGGKWRFVENLPLAQFYQVSVDMAIPFNVYGGVQDSGSWFGPNTVWDSRGILNAHWRRVGCCDGFETIVDFSNPRFGYTTSQNGNLKRYDKETLERKQIRPLGPEDDTLRFNWNSGLAIDAHDSTTIYFGSQYLHRSRNQGRSWEIISPDLTTDVPEKYAPEPVGAPLGTETDQNNTILSIDTSPLEQGVIWVGTDDGNVQLTRDGGENWTNFADDLAGAPDSAYIPDIKASHHEPGRAYVVVDDHRRGDMRPYAYRTDDYGRSWEQLPTGDVTGFLHVVEEDPEEPNLLFLGGEQGLFVSLDRGRSWIHWTNDLTAVPVREVIVHPRDHDLVVGTHGRAIWIVDDIRPLRALAREPEIRQRRLHLFQPPPARQHVVALEGDLGIRMGYRVVGDAMFFGQKRPYGALLSYWIGEGIEGDSVEIEVRGPGGGVVRRLGGTAERGMNRAVWDLHLGEGWPDGQDDEDGATPPEVLPGAYEVSVRVGAESAEASLRVVGDPRQERISSDARRAKQAALAEVGRWLEVAQKGRSRIARAREALDRIQKGLEESPRFEALYEQGMSLADSLGTVEDRLFPDGPFGGGETPFGKVRDAYAVLSSSNEAPSELELQLMERARESTRVVVDEVNGLFAGAVSRFRDALISAGYTPLPQWEDLRLGDSPGR